MMKADDIREWDDAEIEARLKELSEEQFKLRFQRSMMEVENAGLPRQIKRDIARLKTVRRERDLAQNSADNA
jgi:large subunit ribosomal protein L29